MVRYDDKETLHYHGSCSTITTASLGYILRFSLSLTLHNKGLS